MNETDEHQRCGRPTKSGDPCRAQLWGPQIACKIHMTEEDRVGDKYFQEGWRRAIAYNQAFAKRMVQDQIERLEAKVKELESQIPKPPEPVQRMTIDGAQAVQVGKYAYPWRGEPPLKVGDTVLLPPTWVDQARGRREPSTGTVTALGSTWEGEHSYILRRVDLQQPTVRLYRLGAVHGEENCTVLSYGWMSAPHLGVT